MTRESAGRRHDRYNEDDHGPVESAVRKDLAEIGLEAVMSDSYAEICFNLARKLDNGAGMAQAAVAKELRETLKAIEEAAGDNASSDLFARLAASVPTPVRNAT
ncbi:hypothetical protein Aph01nite_59350 [Acrocarpospora phusangensis]|uniref:Uncharacterized protein n=1 Tax=Acrocarpospora phusangensis TaxID=1070424 RepID=A0A919QJS7_9ACTN|nr:hypothetical protein [Acrocarpospora phusangensis]GIH27625.1 hypothetical protein Aph01nite_59350 [Acrocarpospora phusangensis]